MDGAGYSVLPAGNNGLSSGFYRSHALRLAWRRLLERAKVNSNIAPPQSKNWEDTHAPYRHGLRCGFHSGHHRHCAGSRAAAPAATVTASTATRTAAPAV